MPGNCPFQLGNGRQRSTVLGVDHSDEIVGEQAMDRQRGVHAVERHARAERLSAARVIRNRPDHRSSCLERVEKGVRIVEGEADAVRLVLQVRVVSGDDRVDRRLLGRIENEEISDRRRQEATLAPRNAGDAEPSSPPWRLE